MNPPAAYHQLGLFIVKFQHLEGAVNEVIVRLANGDEENTLILVNDFDNSRQLLRADVLFVRFVDIRTNTNPDEDVAAAATVKTTFHELVGDLKKLASAGMKLCSRDICFRLMSEAARRA